MSKNIKWDFTAKCNLKCIHCIVGNNHIEKGLKDISIGERKTIVDNLASGDVTGITFLGGEPLMTNDDIFSVSRYAASKGISTTLVTNGTLLDQTRIDKVLYSGIKYVTVSLDGASSNTHDLIRGDNTFEKTVYNLNKLISNIKACGINIKIKVNTVLNRINYREIEQMIDLCIKMRVNELSFLELNSGGRAAEHKTDLILTASEIIDAAVCIAKKYDSISKSHPLIITQQIAYPLVRDYIRHEYGIDMPQSNITTICCFASICSGYVTPDGNLYPCDRIIHENYDSIRGEKVETMSLLEHPFYDIWNSDYFVKMFELVVDDETYANYIPCNSCKYMETRECNPCPLYSSRYNVSIDTCRIAKKALGDSQPAKLRNKEFDKHLPIFRSFEVRNDSSEASASMRNVGAEFEHMVPSKMPGIRSFVKDGATIIFNPYTTEYCSLDFSGKFIWDLITGENSIKYIASQMDEVLCEVLNRLGIRDNVVESCDEVRSRTFSYFKDLSDAGFIRFTGGRGEKIG